MPRADPSDVAARTERLMRLLREAAPPLPIPVPEPWYAALTPEPDAAGRSAGWLPDPPPGAQAWEGPTLRLPEDPREDPPDGLTQGPETGLSTAQVRRSRSGRRGRHRAPPVSGGGPRVVELPGFLVGRRLRIRGAAVVAALGVVVLAGVYFALRVAAAPRAAEPVAITATRTGIVGGSGMSVTGVLGAAEGTAATDGHVPTSAPAGVGSNATQGVGITGAVIVVHVVGQVVHPGVVRVADGARVVDAIAAAGGALPGADLMRINLAAALHDGEQVHVPAPGESILPGAFAAGTSGSVVGSAAGGGGPVDLNRADLAALDALPGVGPVLAQRILDWRAAHGRFTSVDELGEVSGIGEKLLAQIRPRVTV